MLLFWQESMHMHLVHLAETLSQSMDAIADHDYIYIYIILVGIASLAIICYIPLFMKVYVYGLHYTWL